MRITLILNENPYAIDVDGNCFTAIRLSTNQDATSKNFGKVTESQLGYFNKLANAALRICREDISTSTDVVDLKEFVKRVEATNNELLDQLNSVSV